MDFDWRDTRIFMAHLRASRAGARCLPRRFAAFGPVQRLAPQGEGGMDRL
jgi:hypothetical protein